MFLITSTFLTWFLTLQSWEEGFSTRGTKYHKNEHYLTSTGPNLNISFWFLKFFGRKNKLWAIIKTWIKKIDMCSPWIQKKISINFSQLTLADYAFWKHLQFKCLSVNSPYHQRYQRYLFSLHSLHGIHWRHFLGYIIKFLFMYFMYLDKSYWIFMYWKQHTMIQSFWWVTLYFPVSFYSDTLKKLTVHLYHLLLETQDIILKKYMGRNCLYKKFCFSYNLLLQERVFDYYL